MENRLASKTPVVGFADVTIDEFTLNHFTEPFENANISVKMGPEDITSKALDPAEQQGRDMKFWKVEETFEDLLIHSATSTIEIKIDVTLRGGKTITIGASDPQTLQRKDGEQCFQMEWTALPGMTKGAGSSGTAVIRAYVSLGRVFSWGKGKAGSLGHASKKVFDEPKLVERLQGRNVARLSCGYEAAAFVTAGGDLYTCGRSECLGRGKDPSHPSRPKRVEELAGLVRDVGVGKDHGIAVTIDGHVYTWGSNQEGQLGTLMESFSPTSVDAPDCIAVAAGASFSVAVARDGAVLTCGLGDNGRLGHGDLWNQRVLRPVNELSGSRIIAVAAGTAHVLAVAAGGVLYSWGAGSHGQTGHGVDEDVPVPRLVRALEGRKIIRVAAGDLHSAVISADHELYTWGDHTTLCLGHGEVQSAQFVPRVVEGLKARDVACGKAHTIAVDENNDLYLCGGGKGRFTVVDALSGLGFQSVAAGDGTNFALRGVQALPEIDPIESAVLTIQRIWRGNRTRRALQHSGSRNVIITHKAQRKVASKLTNVIEREHHEEDQKTAAEEAARAAMDPVADLRKIAMSVGADIPPRFLLVPDVKSDNWRDINKWNDDTFRLYFIDDATGVLSHTHDGYRVLNPREMIPELWPAISLLQDVQTYNEDICDSYNKLVMTDEEFEKAQKSKTAPTLGGGKARAKSFGKSMRKMSMIRGSTSLRFNSGVFGLNDVRKLRITVENGFAVTIVHGEDFALVEDAETHATSVAAVEKALLAAQRVAETGANPGKSHRGDLVPRLDQDGLPKWVHYRSSSARKMRPVADTLEAYIIRVTTGSAVDAGMTSTPSFHVQGTRRAHRFTFHRPANGGERLFQRLNTDEMRFLAPDLGDVIEIEVTHDEEGKKPGWFLERLTLEKISSGEEWLIPGGVWLENSSRAMLGCRALLEPSAIGKSSFHLLSSYMDSQQALFEEQVQDAAHEIEASDGPFSVKTLETAFREEMAALQARADGLKGSVEKASTIVKEAIEFAKTQQQSDSAMEEDAMKAALEKADDLLHRDFDGTARALCDEVGRISAHVEETFQILEAQLDRTVQGLAERLEDIKVRVARTQRALSERMESTELKIRQILLVLQEVFQGTAKHIHVPLPQHTKREKAKAPQRVGSSRGLRKKLSSRKMMKQTSSLSIDSM